MPRPSGAWIVGAAVAIGVLLAALWGDPTPPPLRAGSAAPELALRDIESDAPVSLRNLRGRVVLVNFWATWCKPCEDEMPAMERLYRALQPQGFELLAISVDGDAAPVREFRQRLNLSFPILHDPDKRVSRAWQTDRYPESFLIDTQGRVEIPIRYNRAWGFSDGIARVKMRQDSLVFYGFINLEGDWLVQPSYTNADDFNGGLARVATEDDPHFYIDRTGRVIHPQF